jgi:hypothetical protein
MSLSSNAEPYFSRPGLLGFKLLGLKGQKVTRAPRSRRPAGFTGRPYAASESENTKCASSLEVYANRDAACDSFPVSIWSYPVADEANITSAVEMYAVLRDGRCLCEQSWRRRH